jgi:prepilin-type N-terminal cleavage/methylation domain-containing protein
MQKENGFTTLELMVVVGILAILAVIAVPNFISTNSQARLRGAANNLIGDLQMAKSRAVRANAIVVIEFTAKGYKIFLDNGINPGDWNRDADEVLVRSIQLPAGTHIVLPTTFNPPNNRTRFNGRGFPDPATLAGAGLTGGVTIQNSNGSQKQIIINRLGRINNS